MAKTVEPHMVELTPGTFLPAIGLGTWRYGQSTAQLEGEINVLHAALANGPRVIDTAEMYGNSEQVIGRALSTSSHSQNAYLVSKVLPHNATADGTVAAAEQSMRTLGVEHLDLYLLHWRGSHPLQETVQGMMTLQEAGKIGAWGVSNLDSMDMSELLSITESAGAVVSTNQILYNPLRRGPELDLLPQLFDAGISAMAYSPAEEGRLMAEPSYHVFEDIARQHGAEAATIALAWVIRSGNVCAIPMTRSVNHFESNLQAEHIHLSEEELQRIDQAFPAPRHRVPLEMI